MQARKWGGAKRTSVSDIYRLSPKVPMLLLTTTLVDKHSNHGDLHDPTSMCSNIRRGFLVHTGLTANL